MIDEPASSLIRRICHDLTQPLTALQGYIELALNFNQNLEEMRQSLVDAGEEAERISELMRAVRYYADALTPFAKPQQVSLKAILAEAMAAIPPHNGEESPAIFAELDAGAWTVLADADRLKAALQYVLDFCLTHAAAPLTVSLESGQAIVAGRNSHLTQTDCASIFDPHFSHPAGKHVNPAERFRLAAVALIIQRAGGSIAAEAGPTRGRIRMRFTFAEPAD